MLGTREMPCFDQARFYAFLRKKQEIVHIKESPRRYSLVVRYHIGPVKNLMEATSTEKCDVKTDPHP